MKIGNYLVVKWEDYFVELLEMLSQKRDGIFGFFQAQLYNAVFEQLFNVVLINITLALTQRLILCGR